MPTATRTFRVFISSTFEDLRTERNALQERVFPELVKFCTGKGARFQAIDLRWGVREEAGLDQRTMEICLAEIARCQKTGIKPNFVVLLGDRYGQIPLPSRIRKDEFEALLTHVTAEERNLLVFDDAVPPEDTGWYRLDWNAVSPEYLLKPREGEYKERSRWEPIKTRMREALRKLAHAAGLPESDLVKYEASATHQEVLAGLGRAAKDREHVFAFLRNPEAPKDPELKGLIEILRRELPAANIVPFSGGELGALCQQVTEHLKKVIEAEAARFESQSALEQEKEAHHSFARERCRHFVGRAAVLAEIEAYLDDNDTRPLVVHGPSGCGKSAIIARASHERSGIRRFIGATPESSNGLTLLRSLCEELGERYGQAGDLPATFNELAVSFQDRLRLVTAARPLVLYIDALDQFGSQDPATAMGWFPRKLPPNCRAVLATTDVPAALAKAKLVAVEAFSVDEARETLDLWLKDAKRVLQTTQREKVLESFHQAGLPLYLKLAFEEARLWRSFDPLDHCVLGEGLAEIIDRLLMRLSSPANHGEILVRHALGFLTVARYGLTEDEMLDVLSADEEVWRDFEQRARHRPPEHRLPVIVWSRLFLDLEPYLTERSAPGGNVASFYHHQIADQVRQRFPRNDEFTLRWHRSLSAYFDQQPIWVEHERLPNFRMLSELPGHLIESRLWDRLEDRLTDLDFMEASASFDRCVDLIGIFRDALARLPADRARRILVELIAETLNLDLYFISRHPSTVFQCLWNRCWWFDAPAAATYYEDQKIRAVPEISEGVKISSLMEAWLKLKEARTPGFLWVRALHPPKTALASPLVAVYGGFQGSSTCVACSKDGRYIGAGCSDGTVHLWDLTTGAEVLNFEVEPAKYSPITVETDWARKHERHTPSHGPHSIRGITLLNGERFLTDCGDNAIRVRDRFRGEVIACFPGHSEGVQALTCSSDRRLLLSTSGDGAIHIWNLETGVEILRLPGEEHSGKYAVAFSPDGSHFACGGVVKGTRSIRVYESISGREVCCLEGFIGVPHSAAFSPDGSLLAFGLDDGGAKDNTVRIYDWRTRNQLHCLSHRLPVTSVAFSPDGARLASASAQTNPLASFHGMRFAGEIKIWTVQNGEEALSLPGHEDGVYELAFLPSGSKLVSGSADQSVRIWDLNRELLTRSVVGDGGLLHRLLMSPDGSRILSWSELKGAHLWSSFNGRLERRIEPDAHVIDAAFSPDGNAIALSISSGGVRVYHTTTGAEITRFDGHRGNVVGLVFAPDGSRIASLGTDGTVRLWEAVSGLERTCFSGYHHRLRCAAFSPNGSFLATGTGKMDIADSGRGDGELKVWQIDTSSALISVEDFPFVVRSVAFSPDGKVLAAGAGVRGFAETDTNSEIRIFSIEGRSEIARKLDVGGRLMNIAFAPDGQAIVADAEVFISIYTNHGSRVIEFPGLADVEEVAGVKPYRGVIAFAGDETRIESISTGDEVAWYPGRLERLRAHPTEAMWAGTAGAHLMIIKLEGSQESSGPLPRTVWDFPQIQSPKNGEQPATVVAARREIRAAARRNVWRAIFCLIPAYLLAHTKWGRWLGVPFYLFAAFLLVGSLRGWLSTARQK